MWKAPEQKPNESTVWRTNGRCIREKDLDALGNWWVPLVQLKKTKFFSQCVLIPIYMGNMENNNSAVEDLMQWSLWAFLLKENLMVQQQKWKSVLKTMWANMKYSELICLRWHCWHNRGCKSKFTKQIHKEDGDSHFCQG